MDTSDSIGVYGEAKAEYTRQLCGFLVPALETYFLDLLAEVKNTEKDPKRFLWSFQDLLKQFPDWNIDKVQRETEKVQTDTKCDYLEEILTAVFIAHTKVLTAIRLTSKQKKLQITIPKIDHFLHRTMSECARQLWSNAYLLADSGTSVERQKNLRQVEQLIHEAVLQSIRGMLPVKSILKEYLTDETDETASESAQLQDDEKEEKEEKEEIPPVAHEETSGNTSEEQMKEEKEIKEEVKEESKPKVVIEESYNEITDLSSNTVAPPPAPSVPTIVVDTEPPTVRFTHMDAIFDSENPEKTTIQHSSQMETDMDDQQEITHIEFDETVAPEPLDEFEELENETIAVGEDEFERL